MKIHHFNMNQVILIVNVIKLRGPARRYKRHIYIEYILQLIYLQLINKWKIYFSFILLGDSDYGSGGGLSGGNKFGFKGGAKNGDNDEAQGNMPATLEELKELLG